MTEAQTNELHAMLDALIRAITAQDVLLKVGTVALHVVGANEQSVYMAKFADNRAINEVVEDALRDKIIRLRRELEELLDAATV